MSVRVNERSQGDLDVIIKAKQMTVHTVEITNNTNYFPKRYRLTITDKIVSKSFEIFTLLYEANEIYPRNKKDFEDRQSHQRRAMACCRTLVAMIDVAKILFRLPAEKVKYWTKMIVEVRYMTAAWYKKEMDRYGRYFSDKADAKAEKFITEMEISLLEMTKEMQE